MLQKKYSSDNSLAANLQKNGVLTFPLFFSLMISPSAQLILVQTLMQKKIKH